MGKTLLLAGLGKYATHDPSSITQFGTADNIVASVKAQTQALTSQGFTCHNFDVNPHDPADTLARVTKMFEDTTYDGFVIGFGLRGVKEYTALFEKLVNLAVAANPKVRFGFSPSPTGLVDTIGRIFPEEVKGQGLVE